MLILLFEFFADAIYQISFNLMLIQTTIIPLNIDSIDIAQASLAFVINATLYCMSRILAAPLRDNVTDMV